jgi:hypothetical protein
MLGHHQMKRAAHHGRKKKPAAQSAIPVHSPHPQTAAP